MVQGWIFVLFLRLMRRLEGTFFSLDLRLVAWLLWIHTQQGDGGMQIFTISWALDHAENKGVLGEPRALPHSGTSPLRAQNEYWRWIEWNGSCIISVLKYLFLRWASHLGQILLHTCFPQLAGPVSVIKNVNCNLAHYPTRCTSEMGISVPFNVNTKEKKELSCSLVFMEYHFGFQFLLMASFTIHWFKFKKWFNEVNSTRGTWIRLKVWGALV